MSAAAREAANLIEMLPLAEQRLTLEVVKRMVLAWDPDYTKLTPKERAELDAAENGEYVSEDDIDWDAPFAE